MAPLSGVKLAKNEGAEFVEGTGGLVVERRVGRGRIVATAFRLSDRALLSWRSFDGFFNACMLARPPREFDFNLGRFRYADRQDAERFDPRLSTAVRYFTRDAAAPPADTNAGSSVAENPVSTATLTMGLSRGSPRPVPGGSGVGAIAVTDSELELFEIAKTQPGVAAWNDFSHASGLASQSLREAAGISVPNRTFVLWTVGIYLLLIVPVNWLVFRLAGRVEWAWAMVPFIAIGGAAMVVWLAQLDIGFARSETEIAVLEAQNGFSRAHLTRYTALYTSLSTSYNVHFDDPNAVAQPFSVDVRLLQGQAHATVALRRDGEPFLSDFVVSSNSTGMVHSEQMLELGGALVWQPGDDDTAKLENNTRLPLSGVAILRRVAGEPQWAWLGEVPAGQHAEVHFEPFDKDARQQARDKSPLTQSDEAAGELSLRRMVDFAEDPRLVEPGEVRLVGWRDDAPSGVRVSPTAAQARRATLVIADLAVPRRQPKRDLSLYTRMIPPDVDEPTERPTQDAPAGATEKTPEVAPPEAPSNANAPAAEAPAGGPAAADGGPASDDNPSQTAPSRP